MMAFIEQEAKEKVEEIDAKVNKKEISKVSLVMLCYKVQFNRIPARCSQIGIMTSLDSQVIDISSRGE